MDATGVDLPGQMVAKTAVDAADAALAALREGGT